MPSPFQMKVYTICACFDLPARASALNMMQFNGQHGCNFCQQPGTSLTTERGGHVFTFPYDVESPTGPSRTHTGYINDAEKAIKNKSVVCIYIQTNHNKKQLLKLSCRNVVSKDQPG